MTNVYRKFCPDYASILRPLYQLQAAFDQLKLLLCSHPVLRLPDFSKTFIPQTDASEYAIGVALLQRPDEASDPSALLLNCLMTDNETGQSEKLRPLKCSFCHSHRP
eukprot:Gregarina_sp_Poly_1__5718@NODE_3004_length_1459_cov_7_459052_g1901_i0_p2_GENE_NODE_3004_length_1459_cov_7_459052_g1901_i0NODE_3004_length_1459_cov_7_459052_g1901_i0_p2_ORF_typecomplete_len107_score7_70RT_RNaseH_2/PF17919_1/1_3e14RT_RNaseH/PF17917_1/1_8e03RT_RNaseH/PF17917_1/0_043_NODE_3004_length_1459_cov_7_459052_g1901_i0533853